MFDTGTGKILRQQERRPAMLASSRLRTEREVEAGKHGGRRRPRRPSALSSRRCRSSAVGGEEIHNTRPEDRGRGPRPTTDMIDRRRLFSSPTGSMCPTPRAPDVFYLQRRAGLRSIARSTTDGPGLPGEDAGRPRRPTATDSGLDASGSRASRRCIGGARRLSSRRDRRSDPRSRRRPGQSRFRFRSGARVVRASRARPLWPWPTPTTPSDFRRTTSWR